MEEARLEQTDSGLGPVTEGWFVVNVRDAAWDFVHCPPGTEHAFIATGENPCIMVMAGARSAERTIVWPRSELALRHRSGVERETSSVAEALAAFPEWRPRTAG